MTNSQLDIKNFRMDVSMGSPDVSVSLPRFSLSHFHFSEVFPFHFVLDCDLKIVQTGKVLQRITNQVLLDGHFEQYFELTRPTIKPVFESLSRHCNSLFLLKFLPNGMQLKGQLVCVEEEGLLFFLGSPWITETSSLAPLAIKLKDFAIHDQITDFLFLLQAKDTALADTKKLAGELQKQKNQLKSALQVKANLADIAEAQARKLENTIRELQQTQAQLVQTEKMSSLGQLVAGVAHEINNPVNFIAGNINHITEYIQDVLNLIQLYQKQYPIPTSEIGEYIDEIDLDFLSEDLPKIVGSMRVGVDRICAIVQSLRNFSRFDEADVKPVDIHDGLESTLLILQSKLKAKADRPAIEVVKRYSSLPLVECYAGQLNQVFMNLLSNAIDALDGCRAYAAGEAMPKISIETTLKEPDSVLIKMTDNGPGINDKVKAKLFDPFFTTKPIGKGTGLGLSISYQIVAEKHQGKLWCDSEPGQGSIFWIEIPLSQPEK